MSPLNTDSDIESKLRKRNRLSLLCDQCRKRKVKCDRNLPCLTCVKHNCSSSCSYALDLISSLDLGMAGNVSIFRTFKANPIVTASSPARSEPSSSGATPHALLLGQEIVLNFTSSSATPLEQLAPKQDVFDEISAIKTKLQQLENYIGPTTAPLPVAVIDMAKSYSEGQMLPPLQHIYYQSHQNVEQQMMMYQQYQQLKQLLHQQQMQLQLQQQGHQLSSTGQQVLLLRLQPQPVIATTSLPIHSQGLVQPTVASFPESHPLPLQRQDLSHSLPTPLSDPQSLLTSFSPDLNINTSRIGPIHANPTTVVKLEPSAISSPAPAVPSLSLMAPIQVTAPLHPAPTPPLAPSRETNDSASFQNAPSTSLNGPDQSNPTYLGFNPYDHNNPDELLDLYGGYSSIYTGFQDHVMNYGPFTWLSFIRKDRFCNILWNYIKSNGPKTGEPQMIPSKNQKATTAQHEQQFQTYSIKREEISPFNQTELKAQFNKDALSVGLTVFEGEVDPKLNLNERIRLILPTQRGIWILINRFFRRVYPYIPLLDETYFRKHISRILGPETYTDSKYEDINIRTKNDYATLGILLIVLRITYLSSFSNRNNVNERALASAPGSEFAEMKYILSNPINIDVINVARLCLAEFDLYKKNALVVLQCVLFLRIYGSLSPEDGDGTDGNDGHVLNTVCIQISYCMGLNREPFSHRNSASDEKVNNLKRKLWFYLKVIDLHLSYEFGFPQAIHDGFSDIQRPFYNPQNSNSYDINLERTLCEFMSTIDDFVDQFRFVVSRCLNIKTRLKMSEVTELASQLEVRMKFYFGSISDFTIPSQLPVDHPFIKVLKCRLYLSTRIFTMTLYYHFYLNYEKKEINDLCFFYIKKCFSIYTGDLLSEVLPLILHNDKNFDSNTTVPDLILNPNIEFAIHKGNQIIFGLWIRMVDAISIMESDLGMHKENMAHNPVYNLKYTRICTMVKLIDKIARFSTKCISRLSHRYYYAWRVAKAHQYLCNLISTKQFQLYARNVNQKAIDFTSEQLGELIGMAENGLLKMKIAVQTDHKYAQGELAISKSTNQAPNVGQTNTESHMQPSSLLQTHQELNSQPHPHPQTELQPKSQSQTRLQLDAPFATNGPSILQSECNNVWEDGAGVSSSLSLDFEDFGFVGNGAIDDLWKHLSNITGFVDQQIQVGLLDYF